MDSSSRRSTPWKPCSRAPPASASTPAPTPSSPPPKPASEFSSYQRKVFRVADHAEVAFSGLTADGRVLTKFLRNECINHAFVYEAPLPVSRLALRLADKAQAAKTFLERKYDGFNKFTPDQLIKDAITAIKELLQGEKLTSSNCTVAIVGRREDGTVEPFQMIDTKRIQAIINSMEAAEESPAEPSSMQEEDKGLDAAPMDI